ncbi:MAG: protein kinase [Myxococcales bacterium]|nr:protein kinase [Myxococcales bacterium]
MSDPQYIGRYRIVRPLGEGGMGRVLLAEVAGAGGFARRVVLKLVRDELDEALKQSLLDEARVTATLVHRNIVPVLDLHESGAQRLVVLEHIDGMDVRQLLRLTPLLDWPLAAFIGGEVAAALDFAHRRQIIHRDVSPANILVSWEGEVKLSDFGVAKVVGGPGRVMGPTQGLKGKLGYMAPEQMRALPIDARADVYALGVVLYEMLTGKNPMRQGPIVPPPLPSTVPGELAAIVMRAVERNRDDRFNSAADVREAILHVSGQPADPARQLADFLGELKQQHGPALDDVLMDAVLGGKPATRIAGRATPRSSPARWAAAIASLVMICACLAMLAARKLRVHAIAPPPRIAATPPATPPPQPSTAAPAAASATAAPGEAPIAFSPTVVHRKPHLRGLLSVNAIPWANLFVDGRAAGHTPRMKLALEAGKHQLRLVTQAGESRARSVEIAPNKETTLTVVFSEP